MFPGSGRRVKRAGAARIICRRREEKPFTKCFSRDGRVHRIVAATLAAQERSAMTLTQALRYAGMFAAAALLVTAIGMKPLHAIGTDEPTPPTDDGSKQKKKKQNNFIEQQQQKQAAEKFLREYRAARQLIVTGHYQAGIAAMHAIGHDENADVANYIGYSYRKLGDYKDSQVWYEKALAADPNHVRTWSYYGMWQMEQGNRLKALDDLKKVRLICGNTHCEAYRELKAVIDGKASY
jgi:tetratricopeptide (TPR) repeat protein